MRLVVLFLVGGAAGAGAAVWTRQDPGPVEVVRARRAPSVFKRLSAQLARSGNRILVKNVGDDGWTACMVDLNAGVDGGAFSRELGDVRAGQQVALRLATFARVDGRAFDPEAERIQVVDVHCDTEGGTAHFTGGL